MTPFQIQILGCGSAMPTTLHFPASQLVEMNEKLFLVDCGEGAQLQMRKYKTRMSKLHSIFISHLHGDHVFGLPGLISTLNLLGRNGELVIYAHEEINHLLRPTLDFFNRNIDFEVKLILLEKEKPTTLFESGTIRITTFPLKHRIASNGFLFEEKESLRHIRRDMIDFYVVPVSQIKKIKEGADFVTSEGVVVKNELLTNAPRPPRRYAYCSDTAYFPGIIPYVEGVDVLFHEATFSDTEAVRAEETFHSTARQAAILAREAQVKRLVLGHFSSRYETLGHLLDEACEIFPDTQLAAEGLSIVL